MFYVYVFTNKVNGKKYIGKTDNPKERYAYHKWVSTTSTKGSIFHRAIKKYGIDSFEFEILQEFLTEKECFDGEKYYIALYKTNVGRWGSDAGYNLTDGGEGPSGMKMPESAKQKLSEDRMGDKNPMYGKPAWNRGVPCANETKEKLSKALTGRTIPEEVRRKISETEKGRIFSEEHKKKISEAKIGQIVSESTKQKISDTISKNPPGAKLTEKEVLEIRELLSRGIKGTEIAPKFGRGISTIYAIKNNKSWTRLK